jgi:glyoxylase-like metal-dependent hydrolase (beta-lactamase superfamily II)
MKRAVVLGVLLAFGALAAVKAQPPAANAPKVVEVEKVKDNLWVLRGGGGNTAVFATANGVTIVDAKNPGWGQPILDKIKELTPKPVTLLINTHTHGDHVSGNVEFPATVDIVVQENTKANMEKMPIFKEHNGQGMAKRTFKDKMTIGRGSDQIDLYYFGRAHTNGDAVIYFPDLKVVHTGDLITEGMPVLDYAHGASAVEWVTVLDRLLELDFDLVIPGHGALLTKERVRSDRQKLITMNERMLALVKERVPIDQVFDRLHLADLGWERTVSTVAFKGGLKGYYAEMEAQLR